jgi:hypothetical protein
MQVFQLTIIASEAKPPVPDANGVIYTNPGPRVRSFVFWLAANRTLYFD